MDERNDVTVDSFGSSDWPKDPEADEDDEVAAAEPVTKPMHVIRENVDAISEDEPPALKESDVVLPDADATMPDVDDANEKWKVEIKDAAVRWDRLTDEDLLALDRHEASLSELVQKRYSLPADETARQVTDFIKDHQSFAL